jgi:hypothetical protein
MTLPGLSWFSQKCGSHQENRDAGAVFQSASQIFALIGDASARGPHGAQYIRQWIDHVVSAAALMPLMDVPRILTSMKEGQVALREQFPSEMACYAALLIDHAEQSVHAFSCGDCCAGTLAPNHSIQLLTPVHTMANWRGEPFAPEHALMPARHTVTRCLKSNRFIEPDIIALKYMPGVTWILSTDGYWIDHRINNIALKDLQDDASHIIMHANHQPLRVETDCDNWHHRPHCKANK